MYEFYEEPKKLNTKKIIIVSAIIIVIVLIITIIIAKIISTQKETNSQIIQTQEEKLDTFYSNDNSISVALSVNLNLKQYDSDYLLELRSDDNLDIFISRKDKLVNRELSDIVNADKIAFLQNFDAYSNLSDIKELSVNGNLSYTYSFHYLDKTLNTAFYLQIVWMQVGDSYYVFDLEFPLDYLDFYTSLVSSVLTSFKVIN